MRILILVLSITAFLAKDMVSLSWQVWYLVNQQEIAATKCINKAKPMLHCNGKCYLARQLKKLEQKQESHDKKTNPYNHSLKSDWIAPALAVSCFSAIPAAGKILHGEFQSQLQHMDPASVFHPPACGKYNTAAFFA